MSLDKFCTVSRVIRFDDKTTRPERSKLDKLAAVQDIREKWVYILPKLYNPNENITPDEQLVVFRVRCPFKQYILRHLNMGQK
ncbi:DDE_Tnp_1_7 domain-containing protein [Trichonephila clavata]|uniref:DDE_Tnp_1_7 domain-containing protein n=1 Tax=Trichonephila clavata TaxID=2740835 RepID=A0A8X6HVU2_TRICU|nr:DDE_Tnp_1_7 domain-containing protein [Trichonephila clavata]